MTGKHHGIIKNLSALMRFFSGSVIFIELCQYYLDSRPRQANQPILITLNKS